MDSHAEKYTNRSERTLNIHYILGLYVHDHLRTLRASQK